MCKNTSAAEEEEPNDNKCCDQTTAFLTNVWLRIPIRNGGGSHPGKRQVLFASVTSVTALKQKGDTINHSFNRSCLRQAGFWT